MISATETFERLRLDVLSCDLLEAPFPRDSFDEVTVRQAL